MEPVIELKGLSKEYKILNRRTGLQGTIKDLFSRNYTHLKAVNDISMKIMPGEIVGFLGPNGAGKSTVIKMMTGILEPTSGEVWVNQSEPYKNRTRNAKDIGVVFGQRTQLWWSLPVIESFRILKEIYGVDDKTYQENMDLFDRLVGAKELYHKPVRQMSLGQRTLCDILASFLHNPTVVFLDEPTIGLDVSMKAKIRELIKTLNKEKQTTVILTTHDMGDVDALCQRIAIIDKGNMIYDNSIENLSQYFGKYRTIKVKFENDFDESNTSKNEQILTELRNIFAEHNRNEVPVLMEEWVSILINEEELAVMEAIGWIQEYKKIRDIKLEDISTESVIKKIYERGREAQ